MISKPAKIPLLPSTETAKSWKRARTKVQPTLGSCPMSQALGAVACGAIEEVIHLCRQNPALLGILNEHGSTLLSSALTYSHFEGALALTAMGAVVSPTTLALTATPHQHWARVFVFHAPDARSLERTSAAISGSGRPAPSHAEWIFHAIDACRWSLAWDCIRHWSVKPSTELYTVVRSKLIKDPAAVFGDKNFSEPFKIALNESVLTQKGFSSWSLAAWLAPFWDPQERGALWHLALLKNYIQAGDLLVSAGIEPDGWMIPGSNPQHQISALAFAGFLGRSSWFDTLRHLPAAVEAACGFTHLVSDMYYCPANTLAALARLGVNIGVVDERGDNFLHLWARADKVPRSGWTTLGKLCPDLLVARDRLGFTSVEIQRNKLSNPEHLLKFDTLLASIDRNIMAQAAPALMAKTSTSKRRL